jgi:hypothetical protein
VRLDIGDSEGSSVVRQIWLEVSQKR